VRLAQVLKAMQAEGPPLGLQFPQMFPEARIGLATHQLRIAILRHHRNQRLDTKPPYKSLIPSPPRPIHRWAQIIKPDQVPSRHRSKYPDLLKFHE
jgi:hypothetical protein